MAVLSSLLLTGIGLCFLALPHPLAPLAGWIVVGCAWFANFPVVRALIRVQVRGGLREWSWPNLAILGMLAGALAVVWGRAVAVNPNFMPWP